MARIELKHPGQAVADFAVNGHHITVAGITVNCADLQQDTTQIIEVRQSADGRAHIGGDGAYLAHITIPARNYAETHAEARDGQEPVLERVAVDLDANAIAVTLWPLAS